MEGGRIGRRGRAGLRLVELDHARIGREVRGHPPDCILAHTLGTRLGDDQLHVGIERHVLRGGRGCGKRGEARGEGEEEAAQTHAGICVTPHMTRQ